METLSLFGFLLLKNGLLLFDDIVNSEFVSFFLNMFDANKKKVERKLTFMRDYNVTYNVCGDNQWY